MRLRKVIGLIAAAFAAAGWLWRWHPSACPYGQRFWVQAPHPIITRERLRKVLRPRPGERILEIGPGTGYYSLDIAEWVGGSRQAFGQAAGGIETGRADHVGTVEIFDLQQKFLDHVMRRAGARDITNIVPTRGDATALPFEEGSIDAVILTAVLGEIPDRIAALQEVRRVLKPNGRLIIGELIGDPHFTTLASLRRQAASAGLTYQSHSGLRLAYFACLSRASRDG